jgi:hypothetical protein
MITILLFTLAYLWFSVYATKLLIPVTIEIPENNLKI